MALKKNTRFSFQNVKNFQISKVLISLIHFPPVAWFVQGRREDAAILYSPVLRKDAAILLQVWRKDAAILSQVWRKDAVSKEIDPECLLQVCSDPFG